MVQLMELDSVHTGEPIVRLSVIPYMVPYSTLFDELIEEITGKAVGNFTSLSYNIYFPSADSSPICLFPIFEIVFVKIM